MVRFLLRVLVAAIVLLALAIAGYRMLAFQREVRAAEALMVDGSRMVDTPYGRIHVIEAGPDTGMPVLLVHGSIGWAGFWADTLADLADRGYRAMAIDLPPMGLSERSAVTDYSRQAQALRLLAFIETERIRPVIVAHSFGAGAVAEAMITDAQAFRGGVIVAGALSLGEDGTGQSLPAPLRPLSVREALVSATITNPHLAPTLFRHYVHRKDAVTDARVAKLLHPFTRVGTAEALARFLPALVIPPRGAQSTDPAAYAALDLPVALIWGLEDTTTPPEQAEALKAALGDAPVIWLDDVGHIPQAEDPDLFHDALARAIRIVEGPS